MTIVRIGAFEWDSAKATRNLRKHQVTFDEAMGCFLDPHGLEAKDDLHPDRLALIAFSQVNRLLCVVCAEREAGDMLRLISARRASHHEEKLYQDAP